MRLIRQQNGAVLFVALILLVMMTLFAVSSINMSTINLKIVGNMQALKAMDANAQDAIEQILSDMDQFSLTPAASTITSSLADVAIAAPRCIDSRTATGYSAVVGNIIPEDNTWEIKATVTDPVTGASSVIRQGVEIRMLAGNCPD
jgi:Tfp pilus assembly protein PilX